MQAHLSSGFLVIHHCRDNLGSSSEEKMAHVFPAAATFLRSPAGLSVMGVHRCRLPSWMLRQDVDRTSQVSRAMSMSQNMVQDRRIGKVPSMSKRRQRT